MHEITMKDLKDAYPIQSWVDSISAETIEKNISELKLWCKNATLNQELYKLYREDKDSHKFDVILCALDGEESKTFFKYFETTVRQELIKKLTEKFWIDCHCQNAVLKNGASTEWEKMKNSLKGDELKFALTCWTQMSSRMAIKSSTRQS